MLTGKPRWGLQGLWVLLWQDLVRILKRKPSQGTLLSRRARVMIGRPCNTPKLHPKHPRQLADKRRIRLEGDLFGSAAIKHISLY